MSILIQEFSTITAKGQTTVPKSVRQALGISAGDQIAFLVDENGVSVHRADRIETDPALDKFLSFLATDIAEHPEGIKVLSPTLAERIAELTRGMTVGLDDVIVGDVDL
jgi:antitoxin PrlF